MINQKTRKKIYDLWSEGYSSRHICEKLGWPKTRKSTVNDIISKDRKDGNFEFIAARQAKQIRTLQVKNTTLRRLHRYNVDETQYQDDMLSGIDKAAKRIAKSKNNNRFPPFVTNKDAEIATLEVLISDLQIGKVTEDYNTRVAEQRIIEYGRSIYQTLSSPKYIFEKVVIGLMGDLVEDHMKHGIQSAISTDNGLSEQISNAMYCLWDYIIKPIAMTGVKVDLVCVAGNHGSSQHKGMDMFKAGRYSYDYAIYKGLEKFCEIAGYNNVDFDIPEGVFGLHHIYGKAVLYEHGYFNNATEKSMGDQLKKRSEQIKEYIEYFRIGDMHHLISYNCGKMILNGAFFGNDTSGTEYSGILGFSAIPAQAMMVHCPQEEDRKNTIREFIPVQL